MPRPLARDGAGARLATYSRLMGASARRTSPQFARRASRGVACSALALVAVAATLSCGHTLPAPSRTRHPTSAFTDVPFPPPPGRVEYLPPRPREGAVWIDGEWAWEPIGKRWAWKYGRWVMPPAGARFAPWSVVRARDGTLFFAPGAWFDARGREVAAPPVLALGGASDEDIVNPVGTKEPTGANVLPPPISPNAPAPQQAPPGGGGLDGGAPAPDGGAPAPDGGAPAPDGGAP